MKKLTPEQFSAARREKRMDYKVYSSNVDLTERGLEILENSFKKDPAELAKIPIANFRAATQQSACSRLELLTLAYSAGHELAELRSYYPIVLGEWERYAHYSTLYNETEAYKALFSAHIPLKDLTFSYANRLVAFAILLGWKNLLYKIPPIIDYNNPEKDGMLERLLSRYLAGHTDLPAGCTRHLPYFNTIRIFSASASERSALMAEYLAGWYQASRREPYFDSHQRGTVFQGYWSWEAAAITAALNIDDTAYRDAEFYAADLVEFARSNSEACEPDGINGQTST